jgi:hypothetical protein
MKQMQAIARQLHAAAQFEGVESTDPFFAGFQSHGAKLG